MLQQTRVAAVLGYYERFLARFPDAASLADASDDELLAAWSGLGYYRRARNLREAARRIAERGKFPRDHELIRALPGVGDYTAAAVASIAFDLAHAVLDGNALRVLSRLENESGDIRAAATRARLGDAAAKLLDLERPGRFNQALMELGATVCLPREPKCLLCPVIDFCEARRLGAESRLPVMPAKRAPVVLQKTLLVARRAGKILLWKRTDGPRMRGFFELPEAAQLPGAALGETLGEFRHSITNHNYRFTVVRARPGRIPRGFEWTSPEELARLPLSTTARKALAFLSTVKAC